MTDVSIPVPLLAVLALLMFHGCSQPSLEPIGNSGH